ncbi:MAG TPA: hypothetical protein VFG30_15245, partial [Polyangiales bacterium]|nr:hypothetical protein [Polyangiales bacterium]
QRNGFDAIVVDGPVVDDWPDSQSLRGAADAIVFVVASGTSMPDALALAKRHFDQEKIVRTIKTGEWPNV